MKIIEKISKLIDLKSIVTLVLTGLLVYGLVANKFDSNDVILQKKKIRKVSNMEDTEVEVLETDEVIGITEEEVEEGEEEWMYL